MDEIAIKIEHVSKKYRLGSIGRDSLKEDIQSWIAKKRGKEDPNALIEGNTLIGDPVEQKKSFWALNDVCLTIRKGERIGIIGTNGAGKSTLLKILSRITAPTKGVVKINGKITSMLEVGTGFHPELTGRENIYLNGSILGMRLKDIDQVLDTIVEYSECADFIDTPVKRYSSGMYVKLAFSVAAHLNSDIMIMDEVLAVGDAAFQKKCLDKMAEVSEDQGKTILYVSHNMSTIRRLCTRCIVLEKGKLVFDGQTEDAVRRYLNISDTIREREEIDDSMRDKVLNYDMTLRAKLLKIKLLGTENHFIEYREKFQFRAVVQINEEVETIHFRCIVYTIEGAVVGTAMSEAIKGCKRGKEKEVVLEFDSTQMAPGRYSMTVILFRPNYNGTHEKLDAVSNVLVFEIINTKGALFQYQWISGWGGTSYPMLCEKKE